MLLALRTRGFDTKYGDNRRSSTIHVAVLCWRVRAHDKLRYNGNNNNNNTTRLGMRKYARNACNMQSVKNISRRLRTLRTYH